MVPQIYEGIQPNTETRIIPSKTYKANEERISGFVDNIEAVKQAVWHILNVERYSCLIYDNNYGVELEQYIGKDFEFLKVTIEDTLKEALFQDERILNVIVTNIQKINSDIALVEFTVTCIYGDIQMEVEINV